LPIIPKSVSGTSFKPRENKEKYMSHSPLPWSIHESAEIVDADGVFVASIEGEVETDNDDGNRNLIARAVNRHNDLVATLDSCLTQIEQMAGMFDDSDGAIKAAADNARELLAGIRQDRGQQPEKIVFGLSQPIKQPSPGAAGAALRALRTVATVIDEGEAAALDSAEGEILDAITLLEGGTVEGVNGPKNPAKVLVEVNGGCVEYSSYGNVDVLVIDYDAEPDAEIPEEFQGLS